MFVLQTGYQAGYSANNATSIDREITTRLGGFPDHRITKSQLV